MTSSDKRARQRENKAAAREARLVAVRKAQRRKTIIRAGVAVAIFASLVGVLSLTRGDDEKKADGTTTSTTAADTSDKFDKSKRYVATITTNLGVIKLELDAKNAPIASEHFIELAREGFYDGLTWHRASKDFVIQGGDPNGDGTGGSGSPVAGEVPTDNYPIGALAAAKAGTDPPGTFDSQFFIVTGTKGATLPNDYARFGMVTAGLDVAQSIEALAPPEGDGTPTGPATIDSVTIKESAAPSSDATTTTSGATTTTAAPTTTTG